MQTQSVPAGTLVKLLLRAMGSNPAPYVLADFPRMGAHVKQLEASDVLPIARARMHLRLLLPAEKLAGAQGACTWGTVAPFCLNLYKLR